MTQLSDALKSVDAVGGGGAAGFRPDFAGWLGENWSVYQEFERRALQISRFRKHYSARTIVEVMRHDSLIAEQNGEFKINGNFVPDMAKLSMLLNPSLSGFFEIRRERHGEHERAAA